jgi:hypothetical protein
MFLFTVLVITILVLVTVVALVTGIIGAGAIIIFGDVIIAIVLLAWLTKKLFFKRKK